MNPPSPESEIEVPKPKRRGWLSVFTAVFAWFYLAITLLIWIFLRNEGDMWSAGMIAIFAPRWPLLLPLLLLIPLVLVFHRPSIWIVLVALFLVIFPIMDLCLPWRIIGNSKPSGSPIRVLTCNIHHEAIDPDRLAALIRSTKPDIVALQEWMPQFRSSIFTEEGWHILAIDDNCVASRFPIIRAEQIMEVPAIHLKIQTPDGLIDFCCLHLWSPHVVLKNAVLGVANADEELTKNVIERQKEARGLHQVAQKNTSPLMMAGDFNLLSDSGIYRENFLSLSDAFTTAGFGFGWTYHSKWTSMRIDHILTNDSFNCIDCRVGPDVGSPHQPLIADFNLKH
jgi:vancomycin resistance protein VanJ